MTPGSRSRPRGWTLSHLGPCGPVMPPSRPRQSGRGCVRRCTRRRCIRRGRCRGMVCKGSGRCSRSSARRHAGYRRRCGSRAPGAAASAGPVLSLSDERASSPRPRHSHVTGGPASPPFRAPSARVPDRAPPGTRRRRRVAAAGRRGTGPGGHTRRSGHLLPQQRLCVKLARRRVVSASRAERGGHR